ncbi:hypothetical protein EXIGLDRAFT_775055, partial [Exidia glandulosa HHB12029]
GGADITSRIDITFWPRAVGKYTILVEVCTHHNNHIQCDQLEIYIPAGCPLLAEVARAVGLPDDFEDFWDGTHVCIYPELAEQGEQTEEEEEIEDGDDSGDFEACGSSEDEDEEYETADDGETSSDSAGEQ